MKEKESARRDAQGFEENGAEEDFEKESHTSFGCSAVRARAFAVPLNDE